MLQTEFYNADINGKLKNFFEAKGSVHIELEDSSKYVFSPHIMGDGKLNFLRIATTGDSIAKNSMSDTLVLVKVDRVYKFTFKRP